MEKTCRICKKKKPIDEFPLRRGKPDTLCVDCKKEYKQRYWRKNKDRMSDARKKHYAANRDECLGKCKAYYRTLDPEIVRQRGWEAKLKREYGMTPENYEAMLESQSGACAICGRPERSMTKGVVVKLAVDHNHDTDKVRGLLCRACNTALGLFEENEQILLRAVTYLQLSCSLPCS